MASTTSQTPSSSTSVSTTPTGWDVFLSFRGKDTRHGFTSHLYSALDRYSIPTFMDDPELRCGEVISDALLEAIQESKIYIIVLSENYASSSWCLNELVEILYCSKTMQRLIIPVFYNIDPSVVRYQTGSFEEHFKKHEDRLAGEMERVKNWRLTLRQVADKSGKHINGTTSEAHIVQEIVDQIIREINPTALDVARYPVGLDSRVDDIAALLSSGTKGVIKIGIYGMGGVGKTTLANAVFNQLQGSFKGSCFLANVRENSGTLKGLESLQQQLINDVLRSKNKVEVSSVGQGTKLIQARICSTKILVVIDDLDNHENFKSLVGPFASGSVVIITTRDEETLDSIDVETKYRYRVTELDDTESETLLFQHAFGGSKPNNTLLILSKEILRLAGGLPLALEVFGSYLYKKSEVRWKSYIETLQEKPNSTIQQRLMISLDALESDNPQLKKMFVDIACFFIGWQKKEVVEILDTYYSHADDKIDILMKKSLLKINYFNQFRMHDLVQDMGKEIARNNFHDEPGKHSRLWVPKDICYVLEKQKGTEAIEGIMLRKYSLEKQVSISMKTFRRMSKLRFLYLRDINLTGKFNMTLEDLRWFRWDLCPLKCLPSDFCPQELVILELPHSKMTTMWEVNMVSNAFRKLKTLNMSFSCDLTTTPDFRRLPCLEKLNFEGCESLKEVHISIGSLVSLVSLNLNGCVDLRNLPDTICNLRGLEVLCIERCRGLEELPVQLGDIKSLIELNACELSVLKLPDSIGDLSKLVKLNLSDNRKLESLPNTICNLRALEVLNIDHCTNLEALPDELGKVESLRELNARRLCVPKLPDSVGDLTKLVKLYLGGNRKLESLPNTICNLRALEVLCIEGCRGLEELPIQLGNIESLGELNACDLSVPKLPDSVGDLTKLVKLYLGGNRKLESLPNTICNLRALEVLSIDDCTNLEALPDELGKVESLRELNVKSLAVSKLPDSIGNLSKLVKLNLSDNRKLESLPNTICNLRALEVLNIDHCTNLEALPDELGKVESLRELNARRLCVPKLPDSVGDLTKLVKLYLGGNRKLESLPNTICNLRALEVLSIDDCTNLEALPDELGKVESLRELNVKSLAVSKLPDSIGNLSKLVKLNLSDNRKLESLPNTICNLRALEVLNIDHCTNLEALPDELGKVESLRELNARRLCVPKLPDSVGDLTKLVKLYLGGNRKLESLPNTICNLRALEVLSIDDCTNLEALPDELGKVESLRELNARFLAVSKLPDSIGYLSKLVNLNLSDNRKLESLPNTICNLRALEVLNIDHCTNLEELPMQLGNIESLRELNACHLSLPKLPDSVGDLTKLVELYLGGNRKLESLPNTICNLRALEVLCIEGCRGLEELPMQLGNIESLGELNAGDLSVPKLPDSVGDLTKLVKLYLGGNSELEYLPNTICNLRALEVLNIDDCTNLEALPDELGKVESLRELNVKSLAVSKLPDSIGNLSKLVKLNLSDNRKLESLPNTICNLRALEVLCIEGCRGLEELPMQLGNIESLGELNAGDLSVPKLPDSVGDLTKLVKLYLGGNSELEYLPNTICNLRALEVLSIDDCTNLEALPDELGKVESLRELNVKSLAVSKLPDSIGNLSKLVKLNLSDNRKLESLPNTICNLRALEVLNIDHCTNLEALPDELGKVESLRELNARRLCVPKLPDSVGDLTKLVKLYLGGNRKLESLPNTICNLRALEVLSIDDCTNLEALPDELGKVESLRELNARFLAVSKLPDSIGYLSKLVNLNLSDNRKLESLPNTICNLRALEVLNIDHCTNLEELPMQLGNIESLRELNACHLSLPKLPDSVGDLTKLVKLYLGGNRKLESLPNTICNLRALEVLCIEGCRGLEELPMQLGNIESLGELNAGDLSVPKLPDSVGDLTKLVKLYLGGNSELEYLPNTICNLRSLEVLDISGCDKLERSPDQLPPNLKEINAEDCKSLQRLNLSNLKQLKELVLGNCRALTEILGLTELVSLERILLEYCRPPLLALILNKPLFQIYSGFEQKVHIGLKAENFPDWIIQSSVHGSAVDDLTEEISESSVHGLRWPSISSYMKRLDWIIQSGSVVDDLTEEISESSVQGSAVEDEAAEISSSVNLQPNLSQNYLGLILCFQSRQLYRKLDYSVMTSASNVFRSNDYTSDTIVIVPRSIFTVTDADHTIKFTSKASKHWIHLLYKNEDDNTVNVEDERNTLLASDLEVEDGEHPSKRLKLLKLCI